MFLFYIWRTSRVSDYIFCTGKLSFRREYRGVEEQMQALWLTDGGQCEIRDSEPQGEIEEMKRNQAGFQSVLSYELPVFSNW